MEYVLTFDSTHAALFAEREIIKLGFSLQLMATPRSVDSRCGFSILIKSLLEDDLRSISSNQRLNLAGLYKRENKKGVFYYEKIY